MRSKKDDEIERIRMLHVIHAVLGVFLILGGILKLAASGVGMPQADFTTFLSILLAIAEILGGLWMVAGYDPVRTRPWVVAAFVGLWATSAFQAITGKCSCGCFGNFSVNPWFVMLFDLAAVAILLKWDANVKGNQDFLDTPGRAVKLAVVALVMILLGHLTQSPLSVAGTATLAGRPLKNVDLELRNDNFVTTIQTDEEGLFELPPVRPGTYAVTLFGRGTLLSPDGKPPAPARPALPKTSKRMTTTQKKAFLDARKAAEEAGTDADAATIWLKLSNCSDSDVKVEYK